LPEIKMISFCFFLFRFTAFPKNVQRGFGGSRVAPVGKGAQEFARGRRPKSCLDFAALAVRMHRSAEDHFDK
jgi:hypothetical protein